MKLLCVPQCHVAQSFREGPDEFELQGGGALQGEEASALQLTAKRLGAHRRESEMLYFSLKGASIFFSERKNLA